MTQITDIRTGLRHFVTTSRERRAARADRLRLERLLRGCNSNAERSEIIAILEQQSETITRSTWEAMAAATPRPIVTAVPSAVALAAPRAA